MRFFSEIVRSHLSTVSNGANELMQLRILSLCAFVSCSELTAVGLSCLVSVTDAPKQQLTFSVSLSLYANMQRLSSVRALLIQMHA